jgi:hypothetical protein
MERFLERPLPEDAQGDNTYWCSSGVLKLDVKQPLRILRVSVLQYREVHTGQFKLIVGGRVVTENAGFCAATYRDKFIKQEADQLSIELDVGQHDIEIKGPFMASKSSSLHNPFTDEYLHLVSFCVLSSNLHGIVSVSYELMRSPAENPFPNLITFLTDAVADTSTHDVTFSIDGTTVSAHQFMMMRLPYFRSMLGGRFQEGAGSTPINLKFNGVSSQAFSVLLAYIYTDSVDLSLAKATSLEVVQSVLVAAHAMDVPLLLRACEDKLVDQLKMEVPSCFDTLLLSHLHECARLKSHVLNFISNNFAEAGRTKEFLDLGNSNPELFGELVDKIASKTANVETHGAKRTRTV